MPLTEIMKRIWNNLIFFLVNSGVKLGGSTWINWPIKVLIKRCKLTQSNFNIIEQFQLGLHLEFREADLPPKFIPIIQDILTQCWEYLNYVTQITRIISGTIEIKLFITYKNFTEIFAINFVYSVLQTIL